MGLAMVHGIVERFGGGITVESRPGKGTVFTVYLPIAGREDLEQKQEAETLPRGTEHILLVDDEEQIVRLGGKMLEGLGYAVTVRTSSREALALFHENPEVFDLIVTDATMPGMRGDRLAAEMMKIRPDIPVILCTGYSKTISGDTARTMGIRAVAYKPIVKAELAGTVRRVLDEVRQT